MSFSSEIKEKLCDIPHECSRCCINELAGTIKFSGGTYIATENKCVAQRIEKNFEEGFGMSDVMTKTAGTYRFNAFDKKSINRIIPILDKTEELKHLSSLKACCQQSYVRGTFLGGGSVNDPQKAYHLEFDTKIEQAAQVLKEFLKDFGSRITQRKANHSIVYMKECEKIANLLGYIGAGMGAFELYNTQIEREIRNNMNRQVNCDMANLGKVAKASSKHIMAIEQLKTHHRFEELPDTLTEIARLRIDYPEESLKELGKMLMPPIGKSGVNHRLNRLIELAKEL